MENNLEIKTDDNSAQVSIIIPTYNESENIIKILDSIGENLPSNMSTEAIVVDDNSPDGTTSLVEDYIKKIKDSVSYSVRIIQRKTKSGLSSAVINGIEKSNGKTVVVMDSDFSHPPNMIPKMVNELTNSEYDIVIASRYLKDGGIEGWTRKRKMISKAGTKIAKSGLKISETDPMSGFFAFKKEIIKGIKFDAIGYKILLEMLVKTKGAKIKEIPYTFVNRQVGSSKLGSSTIVDYLKAVWKLYRYGKAVQQKEPNSSARFVSKAARFYTVGASGFFVNYLISLLFVDVVANLWYVQANIAGITVSIITNFFLNKIWTFEDRDLNARKTFVQLGKFFGFSSLGGLVQVGMVFALTESYGLEYPIALILGVLVAAFGNFILNKRFTFKEKVWE